MGTVGTWVFPVMWTLCCAFLAAATWDKNHKGDVWLLSQKENELHVAWCFVWSLLGWLVWITAVYWRTRGVC